MMKITTPLFAIMISIALAVPAAAGENLGLGVHVGAHHNVGALTDQSPAAMTDPQNSLLLGFSLKVNMSFFFLRTGFDTTFTMNDGEVLEGSDQIESYSIQYVVVPGFAGFRFPIRDRGEMYMGAGMAYFIADGEVTVAGASEDVSAINRGYGLLAGVEYRLLPDVHFYMEWQYYDAHSEALAKTQTSYTWDNYYLDYSGHRILLGVMYYML
jgi:opacity protein-like surface antigen